MKQYFHPLSLYQCQNAAIKQMSPEVWQKRKGNALIKELEKLYLIIQKLGKLNAAIIAISGALFTCWQAPKISILPLDKHYAIKLMMIKITCVYSHTLQQNESQR